MNEKQIRFSVLFFLLLAGIGTAFAQTRVTGKVLDDDNFPLFPATVVIEETTEGVNTDLDGNFELSTEKEPPFVLVVSFVGMTDQKVEVTTSGQQVRVKMSAGTILNEIVVGASRVPENIMQSPVTVEKMDQIAIQQASTADYYDGISKLKGVTATSGSLTMTTMNTRGFATVANTRFVQLMDGMDNAAPLLNFPTGNIVGIGELDINNVELVPGAASALYGPNAFNGILLMNSKSPFDHQGLSLQIKQGITQSDAGGVDPLASFGARYAKAFNDKFAFKLNASYLAAQDWRANDYTTDRVLYQRQSAGDAVDALGNVGMPNFDGMNMYGDETQIVVPFSNPEISAAVIGGLLPGCIAVVGSEPICRAVLESNVPALGTVDLRRTGFKEEDLLESNNAQSFKGDVALHYKIKGKTELIANYRYGSGGTVYQGSERYALRNFSQQFFKLEANNPDFLVRAYLSQTNDGNSYNLTALGATLNETFAPSVSTWVPNYLGNYAASLIFGPIFFEGVAPENLTDAQKLAAHEAARAAADSGIPAAGSAAFNEELERVRNGLFQKGGAGFIDNSRLYHGEANYNFSRVLKDKLGLLVGGNYRMYDLSTEGTIFNEDPDGDGIFERIRIGEFGVYTQVSKTIIDERLKLTGSIRFDKNQNFEGQFSPRVSAVYTVGAERNHNFRASFQTGFRNPDTQTQYIWFPTTNILLGSTRDNAERYGIHEGGAFTKTSYDAFIANQVINGVVDSSLLQEIYLPYIQPEQLSAYEIGYKSFIAKKLFVDINGFYNRYKNFITQLNVVNKEPTEHRGQPIAAGTTFRPYTNASTKVFAWGAGIGLNYQLPKKFTIGGNYTFSDYTTEDSDTDFEVGFNTPKHRFVVSFGNRELVKNFGFDISYRWQEGFLWENAFAIGNVDSYASLDAQINYKIPKTNGILKVGATNIIGPDYQTNVGGPFVGRQIFASITFNDLTNMEGK